MPRWNAEVEKYFILPLNDLNDYIAHMRSNLPKQPYEEKVTN